VGRRAVLTFPLLLLRRKLIVAQGCPKGISRLWQCSPELFVPQSVHSRTLNLRFQVTLPSTGATGGGGSGRGRRAGDRVSRLGRRQNLARSAWSRTGMPSLPRHSPFTIVGLFSQTLRRHRINRVLATLTAILPTAWLLLPVLRLGVYEVIASIGVGRRRNDWW